jgi:hypothetical protein
MGLATGRNSQALRVHKLLTEELLVTIRNLAISGLLLSLPIATIAHHSVAANFDEGVLTELEGEIARVFWRNPHVGFTIRVARDNGREELWDMESTSVSTLRRMNITQALVSVGQTVRAAGNPSRRGDRLIFVNNLLLPDGREVVMTAGGSPRWATDTLGTSGPGFEPAIDVDDDQGIFRVWSSPFGSPMLFPETLDPSTRLQNYPLTEASRSALAGWDQEADSPIRDCQPKGMPIIMEQPFPVEFVDQGEQILLRIEEYDLVRTIHIDAGTLSDPVLSPLGFSTGQWDGNTLVVTTIQIDWQYFNTVGIPLSEEAIVVEEFTPTEGGGRLDYTMTVTNPGYFTEPVELSKYFHWVPDVEVGRYDCAVTEGGSSS